MNEMFSIRDIRWIQEVLKNSKLTGKDIRDLSESGELNQIAKREAWESLIGSKPRIDEYTLKQMKKDTDNAYLVKMTPPQRLKLGGINSTYIGIDEDGMVEFETTSQTKDGKKYQQTVQLVDLDEALQEVAEEGLSLKDAVNLAVFGDLKVYCSCVAEGTFIKTLIGNKKIENIKPGDFVLSSDGNFHKVQALLESSENIDEAIRIQSIRAKERNILVSKEHKILTRPNQKKQHTMMKAEDLHKKVDTGKKRNKNDSENCNVYKLPVPKIFKNTEERESIGLEKAFILGCMFASGFVYEDSVNVAYKSINLDCITKDKKFDNKVVLSNVNDNERSSFNSVSDIDTERKLKKRICISVSKNRVRPLVEKIKKDFGIEPLAVMKSPFGLKVYYYDLVYESEELICLYEKYIMKSNNNNNNTRKVFLPSLYLMPDKEKKLFLLGYLTTNGSYKVKPNRVELNCLDESCMYDLAYMIYSLDFLPLYGYKEDKGGDDYLGYKNYVSFSHSIFQDEFYGLDDEVKMFNGAERKFLIPQIHCENEIESVKIESIPKDKPVKFYDLSLLTGPHDFVANGIIVSNCPAFLYWGAQYINWELDSGIEPETRFPEIRNPNTKGMLCKHLYQVMNVLPFSLSKIENSLKVLHPELKK